MSASNAEVVTIREIQEGDAGSFLDLLHKLDAETNYMMLEPGERQTTLAGQRSRIRDWLANQREIVLVADTGAELAGYVALQGGVFRRNQHSGYLVLGVRQAYGGRGLGRRLMELVEERARQQGFHRLELTVMTHNPRAVSLYRKLGFEIEGLRRDSLLVGGRYVDEYYMAKLLSGAEG